ncbi:MAG: L,D-transpeptidase family protein [Planctomycetes bacterium]|nr:L,D-transpeptidase family protein [Planctomycetota bacterium]
MTPTAVATALLAAAAWSCTAAMPIHHELERIPRQHRQAVVVRPVAPGSCRAELVAFGRDGEQWRAVLAPMTAILGRTGAVRAEAKREGDGGTPSGVHAIGPAFGYAPHLATKLRYRQATADDWWVDDPRSPAYNTWVTGKPACSAEAMRRDDDQYELGAVLGWNTEPVEPGRGSAIFLHVWKGPDEPTSGCVALARDDVAALLRWLDAEQAPVLVVVTQ